MADGMSPLQTDLCLVFDRGILSELYCDIKGRWEMMRHRIRPELKTQKTHSIDLR